MHTETEDVKIEKAVVADPVPQQPPARPHSAGIRVYGATVASILLMTLARLALSPLLGSYHIPFATYVLAVLFSAWIGGWRAGLLATILSALIGTTLFIPHPLVFSHPDQLVSFLIVCGAIVAISEALSQARRSAEARAQELEREVARRQQAEEASQHERELLQTILDRIPVML
ncbi:MAG TPA: DUF4118 domain-containing protein, partial [Chthonomonadaceae bacterium]|nr:DUF4118 domain-containing protein [Chthonomonadaceae bacterium]